MTPRQRLVEALARSGLSKADVAKLMNKDVSQIRRWFNRRRRTPDRLDLLVAIEEAAK